MFYERCMATAEINKLDEFASFTAKPFYLVPCVRPQEGKPGYFGPESEEGPDIYGLRDLDLRWFGCLRFSTCIYSFLKRQ